MALPVVGALCLVLFLMGTQSAFSDPASMEFCRRCCAPATCRAANGLVLMTTFMAIILGQRVGGDAAGLVAQPNVAGGAGMRGDRRAGHGSRRWRSASCRLPRRSCSSNGRWSPFRVKWAGCWLAMLPLRHALVASIVFWLTAAIAQPAVNSLGKLQLGLNKRQTSYLVTHHQSRYRHRQ